MKAREVVHCVLVLVMNQLVQDREVACSAVTETVSLDEKEGNVSWCGREMRDDVGGRIGLVGVEKLSLTDKVKSEKVDKQVLSGAGVEEGERAKNVPMV